jgi:uncharacterized peroxidase-related enzyme
MVPNVYAIIGHSPGALEHVLGWSQALGTSGLSARELELLNLHISELNGCPYCVSAHATVGARVGLSPQQIEQARAGVGEGERENALLAFVRRVVRTGGGTAGTELARLREVGATDALVVDVLAVVALNAFRNAVNIVAQSEVDFPKAPRTPSA